MENQIINPGKNQKSGNSDVKIYGTVKKKKPEGQEEISIDPVIAEKDEVKNAEERMRQEKK